MKKFMQRFFGIVASATLLVTSGMTGFAAEPGHSHGGGTKIDDTSGPYTITLTHPNDDEFVSGVDGSGSHYGAYQIFSGTVKGTPSGDAIENPGNDPEKHIPITDIKWGNAFGIVDSDEWQKNIVSFVYALAKAPSGDYSYAFGDFNGFESFFVDDNLNSDYVETGYDVTVKVDTETTITNLEYVKYEKLAVAVADVLVQPTHIDNHEWLQAFNDILGGFGQGIGGNYKNPGYVNRYYEGEVADAGKSYQIKVPAGYYMIRDLSSFGIETDKSYSARMLFVADNVTQELKESVPTLDKHVVRADGKQYETEAAGVGDDVEFRLTGTLPDNYDLYLGGYQYKFTDTLSKGLTLNKQADNTYVTVTVNKVYDDAEKKYVDGPFTIEVASYKSDGTHTASHDINAAYTEEYIDGVLTVFFPCLKEIVISDSDKEYTLGAESEIYIDYTAVVNENAVVSPKGESVTELNGNTNTAVLEYSDNPQSYADTDKTTEDNATVYTFGLDIVKIDAAQYLRDNGKINNSALKGAKFAVVRKKDGTSGADTKWEIAKFTTIGPDIDSEKNLPFNFKNFGYYSIVSWETITNDDNEDVKGEKFNEEWLEIVKYNGVTEYNIETLVDGVLNISGLNDGIEYTIAETATPDAAQYAKIDPFTITLTAATDGGEYTGKLSNADSPEDTKASFSFDKPVDITDNFESDAESDGSANMLVANFKYTDLPSTGGVGTYWFYIIGGGVIAISGVLFFLSRKKTTK